MSDLATKALAYAKRGIFILPCWWVEEGGACGCGDPKCRAVGKHPVTKLVPRGVVDASSDVSRVAAWWAAFPRANIGMACGKNGIAVIDIDPRNGGDATWADAIATHGAPDAPTAKTGGGGEHLVFMDPEGTALRGRFGPGVDVKSGVAYVLVEPSRTQGQYLWLDDGDLSEPDAPVPPPMPAWLLKALTEAPTAAVATAASGAVRALDDQTLARLRKAISWLVADDRDIWVSVGLALKTLGAQGFALWDEWSKTSSKYRADDQGKRWAGFKPAGDINVESIFFRALQAGWRDDDLAALQVQVEHEAPAETARFDAPFPVSRLDEVASILGGPADMARLGAVMLASLACARRYVGEDGTPGHLYAAGMADSVGELRTTLQSVQRVIADAGLRKMIRSQRITAPTALWKTIQRSPAFLWVTDEYAHVVAFAKRQPSGLQEQTLNALATIYQAQMVQLDSSDEAGFKSQSKDDAPVLYYPSLSILAAIGAADAAHMTRAGEVSRGSLEQFFIVDAAGGAWREPRAETPGWLVEHMRRVRGLSPGEGDMDLAAIFSGNAELMPTMAKVRFMERPESYDAAFMDLIAQGAPRPLVMGARHNFRRIGVALSAWADPDNPVLTRDICEWAAAYTLHHFKAFLTLFRIIESDDGKLSVRQKVLEALRRAGPRGMARRDLFPLVWGFRQLKKADRDQLIAELIENEDVREISIKGTTKAKKILCLTDCLKNRQYAENAEDCCESNSQRIYLNKNNDLGPKK